MYSRPRGTLGFLLGIALLLASSAGIGMLITLMTGGTPGGAQGAEWKPIASPTSVATTTAAAAVAVASSPTVSQSNQQRLSSSLSNPQPLRATPPPLRTAAPSVNAAQTTVGIQLAPSMTAVTDVQAVASTSTPEQAQPAALLLAPSSTTTPEAAASTPEPTPSPGSLRQIVSAVGAGLTPRGPQPVRVISPPEPTGPEDGTTQQGVVFFTWLPTGPLPEDAAYEVVWWVEGQDPSTARGLAPPTRDTILSINLDVMYQANLLGSGNVYWAVIVVRPDPYTRLTSPTVGQTRRFVYQPSVPPPPPSPTPEPPPEQPKP